MMPPDFAALVLSGGLLLCGIAFVLLGRWGRR